MAQGTVTVDGYTFYINDLLWGRVRWWWLPRRRAAFRKSSVAERQRFEQELAARRERAETERARELRSRRKEEKRRAFRERGAAPRRRGTPAIPSRVSVVPTAPQRDQGGAWDHDVWPRSSFDTGSAHDSPAPAADAGSSDVTSTGSSSDTDR